MNLGQDNRQILFTDSDLISTNFCSHVTIHLWNLV